MILFVWLEGWEINGTLSVRCHYGEVYTSVESSHPSLLHEHPPRRRPGSVAAPILHPTPAQAAMAAPLPFARPWLEQARPPAADPAPPRGSRVRPRPYAASRGPPHHHGTPAAPCWRCSPMPRRLKPSKWDGWVRLFFLGWSHPESSTNILSTEWLNSSAREPNTP